MKKKLLALVLACAMALGLAACGGSKAETPAGNNVDAANGNDAAKTYLVGICQLAPHPALDAATQGFKDALTEALGEQVRFEEQNAAGESNTCSTIVNGFVSENVDLILANASSALQAAASATGDIPVHRRYGVRRGAEYP